MTTQKKRWNLDRSVSVRNYMLIATFVLAASLVRADDVVVHWNRVMLSTIAAAGTNPLVSTRVTAIVQTAVFDSVNGIQPKYSPIHANFPKPIGASASAAVIESAYLTLVSLYPDQQKALNAEGGYQKWHRESERIDRK